MTHVYLVTWSNLEESSVVFACSTFGIASIKGHQYRRENKVEHVWVETWELDADDSDRQIALDEIKQESVA